MGDPIFTIRGLRSCDDEAETDPVCASNGNVYKSVCHMKKETCGEKVVVADLNHCQTTK